RAEFWLPPTDAALDMTLKLQALSGLLETHSAEVIPLLREIALDRNSPDEARGAVFVLGQSHLAEAQRAVVEVAHQGAEPVRLAAVRELGRFEGPTISSELMQVYTMAGTPPRLKRQVVSSLGERADSATLLRIVRSESEPTVRNFAIVTLGRTGARRAAPAVSSGRPRFAAGRADRALHGERRRRTDPDRADRTGSGAASARAAAAQGAGHAQSAQVPRRESVTGA